MGVIKLDGGDVLGEGPLDDVAAADAGEDSDGVVALVEAGNGEVAGTDLDAALVVDEVGDGAGDGDENIFRLFDRIWT